MCRITLFFIAAIVLSCPGSVRAQSFESALWITDATAAGENFGLDASATGAVYMTGKAAEGSLWSDGTVFDAAYSNHFIARFNADGSLLWVRSGVPLRTPHGYIDRQSSIYAVASRGNSIFVNEGHRWDSYESGATSRWGRATGLVIRAYTDSGDSLRSIFLEGKPPPTLDPPAYIEGLGTDAVGNVYVAGYYIDSLRLGPSTLLVPPRPDRSISNVFVAGYTGEGHLRWAHQLAGDWYNYISWGLLPKPGFYVDGGGNVYLGGFFTKGTVFGEERSDSLRFEADAAALASFGIDGSLRWVRTALELGVSVADVRLWSTHPSAGSLPVPWLATANERGEFGLFWRLRSTISISQGFEKMEVTVGDTTFSETTPLHSIYFVTKHALDGTLQWAQRLISDVGYIPVTEIAMDPQGDIYIGGAYDGNRLHIADTVLQNDKDHRDLTVTGFAAHFDVDGQLVRALHVHKLGPSEPGQDRVHSRVTGLVPMPTGEVYVSGYVSNRDRPPVVLVVGMDTLKTAATQKVFLAKYGPVATARAPDYVRPAANIRMGHFPNPFEGTATITYELPTASHVVLKVFDLLGRELAVLVDGVQGAGPQLVRLNASAWPNGVYLYRLEAGNQVATGRLVRHK